MEIVNFIFEKLGWEKVNFDFLKVCPPKKNKNFLLNLFHSLGFKKFKKKLNF